MTKIQKKDDEFRRKKRENKERKREKKGKKEIGVKKEGKYPYFV